MRAGTTGDLRRFGERMARQWDAHWSGHFGTLTGRAAPLSTTCGRPGRTRPGADVACPRGRGATANQEDRLGLGDSIARRCTRAWRWPTSAASFRRRLHRVAGAPPSPSGRHPHAPARPAPVHGGQRKSRTVGVRGRRMGRLPFAVAEDGSHVLVHEVERGLACGCSCPECAKPVLARQGEHIRWHFAHSTPSRCTGESALHAALVRQVAETCRVRGFDVRTEHEWQGRRFDVAVLATDAGHCPWEHGIAMVYEIAVSNRKDRAYIEQMARARIPAREAQVDMGAAAEILNGADTWTDGVQAIVETLTFGSLWSDTRGRTLLAVCKCGNRKPCSSADWCRRCEKARTCRECGGQKNPGFSTCLVCYEHQDNYCDCGNRKKHKDDDQCQQCEHPENWCSCGKWKREEYDSCYECGYIPDYPERTERYNWRGSW